MDTHSSNARAVYGTLIRCEVVPPTPSPLAGEGGAQRRMRGQGTLAAPSSEAQRKDGATPHPAFGRLLPQGEKASSWQALSLEHPAQASVE